MSARLSLLGLLLLGLACGRPGAPGAPETLVFSYGVGAPIKERLIGELLDAFEAEHPRIKVHRHRLAGFSDTDRTFYLSSLGAGSAYVDLFEMDLIWLAEMAAGGLLLDLAARVPEDERAQLLPAAREAATYQDKQFAMPFYLTLGALWYRPSLLDKHQLSPPSTWVELVGQAKLLSGAEGIDGYLFQGRRYEGLTCAFLELYHNAGGELGVEGDAVRFDQERLRETLRRLHNLIHEQGLSPRAVADYTELEAAARFRAGEAAFMRAWQTQGFDLAGGKINRDYAYVPPPGRGASLVGGALLGINARSQHVEAALALARYWQRADVQHRLATALDYAPVRAELYQGADTMEPRLAAIRALARNVRFRPRSPGYHHLSVVLMQEMHALVRGETTPDAAADAILERSRNLSLPRSAGPDFPARLLRLEQY